MDATRITPKPNDPLIVEGPVKIVTPDGRELAVPPRKDGKPAEVVVLCRCGGSATKPVCDGNHKRNGFSETPPANPAPTLLAQGIILSPPRGGDPGEPPPTPPPLPPPPLPPPPTHANKSE